MQDLIASPKARVAESSHVWKVGDLLEVRKERWRVLGVTHFPACTLLNLVGVGRMNAGRERALLTPFDRPSIVDKVFRPAVVRRGRWMQALRERLSTLSTDFQLRAAADARIDLFPYQLEPALAVVRGLTPRLLIADDVGLGKTIQAGLILAELRLRRQAERVLILTPAALRSQWQSELADRFRLEAEVIDAAALARQVATHWRGLNPWALDGIRIVSIDFAKRPEALGPILESFWDVVLVDEAHGATAVNERAAAVRLLASRARRLVLLTATPHTGRHEAFVDLCRLGRLDDEEPIALFRRTRSAVGHRITRRVRLFRVRPTAAERDMHIILRAYIRRVWRGAGDASGSRLAMIVLAKRACSSAGSLQQSAERRLALLSGEPIARQAALPFSQLSDDDQAADRVPDETLAAPGFEDVGDERDWLLRVIRAANTASKSESKIRFIVRLLGRTTEPALVFTEYRDTLDRVLLSIGDGTSVVSLHGGQTEDERRAACRQFVGGDARVMVATDAASEGLNLQRTCRLIVNLELPWNPMRLEQRIGRVDRIGQTRVVHACHLLARGTSESVILGRLVARWESARRTLGHMPDPIGRLTEGDVAPRLIDWPTGPSSRLADLSVSTHAPRAVSASTLSSTIDLQGDARLEAHRLTVLRHLRARRGAPGTREAPSDRTGLIPGPPIAAGPWITTSRKSSGGLCRPGLVAIYHALVTDGSGHFIDETVVPLEARLVGARSPHQPSALRDWLVPKVAAVAPDCERLVRLALAGRVDVLCNEAAARAAREASRENALARSGSTTRSGPVQAGLFDRRAETMLGQLESRHQERLADSARRLAALALQIDRPFDVQVTLILILISSLS